MTSLASPHGLAVVGALFMLSGLAILGAALLNRTTLASLVTKFDSPARLNVAAWFALPMLAFGLFLQAAGNMVAIPIGPGLSALLLALAFGLLMFLMLDETIADVFAQSTGSLLAPGLPQLALPAPGNAAAAMGADNATGTPEQPGLALAS